MNKYNIIKMTQMFLCCTLQVLQVIGDKFSNVIADINGIGVHVKPLFSKITIWTVEITLDNYKNINEIG
jgi:hypothetical protein